MSDAEHVKSVCWRGSPDPLQRPRPARLLGEGLAGSFKRLRSPCGRSHRSDRRNRPQRWSSSRLCRVHPALDRVGAREGQLPLPNTPSVADDAGGLKRGCTIGVAAGVTALALTCGCCVTGGPPRTPSTPRPRVAPEMVPLRTRFLGRLEILPGGPVGASKSLQRAAALASTPRREGETAPHALARGEPP